MSAPVYFAGSALPEFWGEPGDARVLFLGPWCLTEGNAAARKGLDARVLSTPWSGAGAEAAAFAEYDHLYAALLAQLSGRLGERHGLARSERWWRIVLGPWLMNWLTTLQDRLLHAQKARAEEPSGRAVLTDAPLPTPRDTGQYIRWLPTDAMNQHLFSAAFRALGVSGPERPAPAPSGIRDDAAWRGPIGRSLSLLHGLARRAFPPRAAFSSLLMPRKLQRPLVLRSGGRLQPVLTLLPDPPAEANDPLRRELAVPVDGSALAKLAAATLPAHLPRLFLEGWDAAFAALRRDWPALPKVALSSVGWSLDEPFKLLAAETVESGGKLVLVQHGGAYGLFDVLYNERHERAVADEWWSWGWSEEPTPALPAKVVPVPHPRLVRRAREPERRGWQLVTHALPRSSYTFYYCNVPLWPRYEEYLAQRERFARALAPAHRDSLVVRLPIDDFGWDMRARLERAAPGVRCEEPRTPLVEDAARFRLNVVDQPQTSLLELVGADLPTLAFWDPALWRMRPSAKPALDALRKAGVLYDDPESAARAIGAALADPDAWWREPARRRAVEGFRASYALGSEDWSARWLGRLSELEASA